jgi:hypothetical protein
MRETLKLTVKSNNPHIDSLIKERFIKKLSERFDVSENAGRYRLLILGDDITNPDLQLAQMLLSINLSNEIEYSVTLVLPEGKKKQYGATFTAKKDWLLGFTTGTYWVVPGPIYTWINKCIPHSGNITEVDAQSIKLNIGRNVDVRIGDEFEIYGPSGKRGAIVKVCGLSDSTSVARWIDRKTIMPGDRAVQKTRLLPFAMGVEYTYLFVPSSGKTLAGQQLMMIVPWRLSFCQIGYIQFASGYIDVVQQKGWHVLSLSMCRLFPLIGRKLDIKTSVGAGMAALRLTDKRDPITDKILSPLGMMTYNLSLGLSFRLAREHYAYADIGYLGYTRFSRPNGPSLHIGYFMWAY